MTLDKASNEYGSYLEKQQIKPKSSLNIVYLHDFLFYPEIHNNFAKNLNFFNYYAFYIPYGRKTEYDEEVKNETININYYVRYIKDLILGLNSDQIYLIAEGVSATIALIIARLLKNVIKKVVLVNPFTSFISIDEIGTLINLPVNIHECYEYLKTIFGEHSPLLTRKENSEIVIKTMRLIYYNYDDLSELVANLTLSKTIEMIKVYEQTTNDVPILLIVSEDNHLFRPNEIINAYKNKQNVKIVKIPNNAYEPVVENSNLYFQTIMKFLINGIGLNNENQLPSKELYQYLSDDWKQYYRYQFAEKLSERDKNEYLQKLNEYEKETQSIVQNNPYDEQTTNEYVNQQINVINQIYNQVDKNFKKDSIDRKTQRLNLIPDIMIDYNYQPNKIYQNQQGYYVYHDGRGNGFYNDNGVWKKIINK